MRTISVPRTSLAIENAHQGSSKSTLRKRSLFLTIVAAGVAGAAAFGWTTIRRGFSARDNPSAIEAFVARTARKLSIPASERDAKNPFTPTVEVLNEARAHFADHCATCHGNDGSGKTEIGQNLYPKPPDMRQSETQSLTDGQIVLHHSQRNPSHRNARVGQLRQG